MSLSLLIKQLEIERDEAIAMHAADEATILKLRELLVMDDQTLLTISDLTDRLTTAELHLFSGHGCDCRHMAERRAAYLASADLNSEKPE